MRSLEDCCKKLSKGHFMSRNALTRIDNFSLFWRLGSGSSYKAVGINSMASKVLCVRHNSRLADLDTVAGNSLDRLADSLNHLLNPESNRKKERDFLVDGYALELWTLKALIGAHVSGALSSRTGSEQSIKCDLPRLVRLLSSGQLPSPLGFYYQSEW